MTTSAVEVTDNTGRHRFEISLDGALAGFERYEIRDDVVELVHTQTMPGYEGRGVARTLVRHILDDLRTRGCRMRPVCPYVRGFVARNREYADLVPPDEQAAFGLE